MFLRATKRFKDGREHRYWSIVENRRCRGHRVVQRQVLYLGEINDAQHAAWCKSIAVLQEDGGQLLLKLGAAKKDAGRAWSLVRIVIPDSDEAFQRSGFDFSLREDKLREARQREGRYLLRSNLTHGDPAQLWQYYIQLTEIEQAFKELKSDLAIRPIYHQKDDRIEAHIFVAFVAYCLQVTLKQRARTLAPGLTPRAVLEKFKALQMVDVHLPTTDGRVLELSRYTQPEKDLQLLLEQLQLTLPEQPPPKIRSADIATA